MDAREYFQGKQITVTGLGLLGRGVGDVAFLAKSGAIVTVTDLKTAEELAPSIEALKEYTNITYRLGRHDISDFEQKDLIIKGPKTPLNSPYIAHAKELGIPVTMSTALFARFAKEKGATLIGITGTRGKTTTTEMIAHILREAGTDVLLGGNIRGVSTLGQIENVTAHTVCVLELDSWQLQGFKEEKLSPDIAVFTTFYPDHMDYYSDMETYLDDKAQIFLYQEETGVCVLGNSIADMITKTYGSRIRARIVTPHIDVVPSLSIPGVHNKENASCAYEACKAYGLTDSEIQKGLSSFSGVPGRLHLIKTYNGISIYNDTTATTPEATLSALSALDTGAHNIIWIGGGYDKGLDMNKLAYELQQKTKRMIMLAGTGTNRMLPLLTGASVFDSLESAVAEAVRFAVSGDVILFSPAFASFGMFKNEYDRGDQFTALFDKVT